MKTLKAVLAGVLAALAAVAAFLLGRSLKRGSGENLGQARALAVSELDEARSASMTALDEARARSDRRDREAAADAERVREELDLRRIAREGSQSDDLADEANRILDGLEKG